MVRPALSLSKVDRFVLHTPTCRLEKGRSTSEGELGDLDVDLLPEILQILFSLPTLVDVLQCDNLLASPQRPAASAPTASRAQEVKSLACNLAFCPVPVGTLVMSRARTTSNARTEHFAGCAYAFPALLNPGTFPRSPPPQANRQAWLCIIFGREE